MTYKEELKVLLSEGHKLGEAHKILKERRNSQENSPVAQTEELPEEEEEPSVSDLKAGDKVTCPECKNSVGITLNYLNNIGKRGLHCYQCSLTFHL